LDGVEEGRAPDSNLLARNVSIIGVEHADVAEHHDGAADLHVVGDALDFRTLNHVLTFHIKAVPGRQVELQFAVASLGHHRDGRKGYFESVVAAPISNCLVVLTTNAADGSVVLSSDSLGQNRNRCQDLLERSDRALLITEIAKLDKL